MQERSVSAVNSALQRARATLGQAQPTAGISARSLFQAFGPPLDPAAR
jgi:hypothetical protein